MNKIILLILLVFPIFLKAQFGKILTNEKDIPKYTLPELLVSLNGKKVNKQKKWEKYRRDELLGMFEEEVYGKVPGNLKFISSDVIEKDDGALGGLARRRQISLSFENNGKSLYFEILMYLPTGIDSFPIFLAYNFYGNHTVNTDFEIRLTESWVADNHALGIAHNQVTEQSRGAKSDCWPIEKIIGSDCGFATVCYGEIDPDRNNFNDGIHSLLYKKRQQRPKNNEWGSIAAWAWGLSRVLDYFEINSETDASKVIVVGHDQLGKAALWAGASDQRFAGVISSNSGCGGAALSKRLYGQTVSRTNYLFPHWFCENFKSYSYREDKLPVDQHMLLALIAPRPLYVVSSTDNKADPTGEFISTKLASSAYQLYGFEGFTNEKLPPANTALKGRISYHIKSGKSGLTDYDWEQFISFAKSNL